MFPLLLGQAEASPFPPASSVYVCADQGHVTCRGKVKRVLLDEFNKKHPKVFYLVQPSGSEKKLLVAQEFLRFQNGSKVKVEVGVQLPSNGNIPPRCIRRRSTKKQALEAIVLGTCKVPVDDDRYDSANPHKNFWYSLKVMGTSDGASFAKKIMHEIYPDDVSLCSIPAEDTKQIEKYPGPLMETASGASTGEKPCIEITPSQAAKNFYFPPASSVYIHDQGHVISRGEVMSVIVTINPTKVFYKVKKSASAEYFSTDKLRFQVGCKVKILLKDVKTEELEGIILGNCDVPVDDDRHDSTNSYKNFCYSVQVADKRIMHDVCPDNVSFCSAPVVNYKAMPTERGSILKKEKVGRGTKRKLDFHEKEDDTDTEDCLSTGTLVAEIDDIDDLVNEAYAGVDQWFSGQQETYEMTV
jgi:hypothetical protein